jgi:hypothetical protein
LRVISVRELEQMPLDTAEHVWMAWVFIHRPALRQGLQGELDQDQAAELLQLLEHRIRKAAFEHGVLLFAGTGDRAPVPQNISRKAPVTRLPQAQDQ